MTLMSDNSNPPTIVIAEDDPRLTLAELHPDGEEPRLVWFQGPVPGRFTYDEQEWIQQGAHGAMQDNLTVTFVPTPTS